jgi:hypothetical protein
VTANQLPPIFFDIHATKSQAPTLICRGKPMLSQILTKKKDKNDCKPILLKVPLQRLTKRLCLISRQASVH